MTQIKIFPIVSDLEIWQKSVNDFCEKIYNDNNSISKIEITENRITVIYFIFSK